MKHLTRIARLFLRFILGTMAIFVVCSVLSLAYVRSWFPGNAVFPADCGIVFGTAVRPSFNERGDIIYTAPGPGIQRRVGVAADLYRTGNISRLFVTGGKGEGMVESEASVMQRYAVVRGVALDDIVVEGESRSTWENLRNTLPLMKDCKTIVGFSDRYHLGRIRLWSIVAGRPIQVHPAEVISTRKFEQWSILRETMGILATPFVWLL